MTGLYETEMKLTSVDSNIVIYSKMTNRLWCGSGFSVCVCVCNDVSRLIELGIDEKNKTEY
jgi:hypothetical protein